MEEQIMPLLVNGGANFAFAVFLYMQNKELKQRADDREAKLETREIQLRDRYDEVIKDYQKKEETMRESLVKEIVEVDKRISLMEQRLDSIYETVSEIKTKFQRVV